jgi:DNA polymerase V
MSVSMPIPFEAKTSLRIPLVSANVQAGFPSPADDHLERSINLNKHLVKNPAATFFLGVKGDSMWAAGIVS